MKKILFNLMLAAIAFAGSHSATAQDQKENQKVSDLQADGPGHDTGDLPLLFAEQMPEFPGGQDAMMKFITDNLVYPAEARKKQIEAKVIVQYVVKADGTVTDWKIIKGHDLLNAEALRIVSIFPKFTPGKQNGKPVAVQLVLPFAFRLN